MEFKKGSDYVIVVNSGKILTFRAKIISYDETFITFIDINKNTHTYNKNTIVSLTPIELISE